MSDQEILSNAINKALSNGWNHQGWKMIMTVPSLNYTDIDWQIFIEDRLNTVIYDHDFAKAIWGDRSNLEHWPPREDDPGDMYFHLQQMVIAEDPIRYLGENS